MINLIPKHAKKSIRIEYFFRVASVWLILWSASLVAATATLLPPYVLIGTQVTGYEQSASEAMERVLEYEDTSAALALASQEAKRIIDESVAVPFSKYIHLIESLEGGHIKITEIRLERKEAGVAPVLVSGVATDRQALASFRDRLLASEQVTEVDLPISNLTSDKNIIFNLTVTLANNTSI